MLREPLFPEAWINYLLRQSCIFTRGRWHAAFTFAGSHGLRKDSVINAVLKGPGAGCGKDNSHFSLISQWKHGLAVWEMKEPPTQAWPFQDADLRSDESWRKAGWLNSQLSKRAMSETHLTLESLTSGLYPWRKNTVFYNVHNWVSSKCFEIKVTSWAWFVLFETVSLI